MILFPSDRSIKKVTCLCGFKLEFAADRFFDFQGFSAIIARQLLNGFTSFVSFGNYGGSDPRASKHGPAERNAWINHDGLWGIRGGFSRKGI